MRCVEPEMWVTSHSSQMRKARLPCKLLECSQRYQNCTINTLLSVNLYVA